ncbi:DUF6493 family protein [Flavobacterium amniphilum]|uniref:DUF6493 family protein n=1 Tax=Flavobacterium amniphilum TaxID=1834035 RepID=UPI002029D8D8|nr:DUF6493 family protein [Flavobacterium amniphilum]MCL9804420.1 DUF6493 family protein [Flavobacterium amniphilum]
MKKHLKYIDGSSDKFWQIEVTDSQFTVTYGKNGTSGTSQVKSFESSEECLKAAEKLLSEKTKKGYSENGEVAVSTATTATKTAKASNIDAILEEYDAIIKAKDVQFLLPFLIKNAKGNIGAISKHVKKCRRYWTTFTDLSNDPGYKPLKGGYNWGTRGDEKVKDIITLSTIALFDKNDMLSNDDALPYLQDANNPHILEILEWAKPNWITSYLLERFRRSEWTNFKYRSLRFLEEKGLVEFDPELTALCLPSFSTWREKITPREYINYITTDKTAYERDVLQVFYYETGIQNGFFKENETAKYDEFYIWEIIFSTLLNENKLDRNFFIENCLLIQTKEWNNNLKSFFRKRLAEQNLSDDELILYQETIFTYSHNANPVIVNYGSELVKQIFTHPKFKHKNYFEWIEPLLMRNDCKTAVKNNLMVLEKISKANPKLNKSIALLCADVFLVPDVSLQERAAKIISKSGNPKDKELTEKLSGYASLMQGNIKPGLSHFLSEEDLIVDESQLEIYRFSPKNYPVLTEEVVIPDTWNEIMFLFGKFIASEDPLDSELLLNVYTTQRHLFPQDYKNQLQPYHKQLDNNYFSSVQKSYVQNLLINKINDKHITYTVDDKNYVTLKSLGLIKPVMQKVLDKNKVRSNLPLLSLPTHKPHWIAPKTLVERLIAYQQNNEDIDYTDLSIAISRMPRENTEEALPLLEQLDSDMKNLMSFCLGTTKEIAIKSGSIISKLFSSLGASQKNDELAALWAVAARTHYPGETFEEFEKTALKDIPNVVNKFNAELKFEEKSNEWKDYHTQKLMRTSWTVISYQLPEKKSMPANLLYSLDLCKKKSKRDWLDDFTLATEANVYHWNSLMPQNNDPLAWLLMEKVCDTTDGTKNELKGFLNIVNQQGFQLSDIILLVFACCFFMEKKDIRLMASEVLINLVEQQSIDVNQFGENLALLISNKYGVLLRMIDGIIALKDISPLHNSALFLILDHIFQKVELAEKLPTNFKKLVENYVDVLLKTNQKPSEGCLQFFGKLKDNTALKTIVKQILT